MQTALDIALAVGTVLSLVLHYIGKTHPSVETAAEDVDAAEKLAQGLKK